MRTKNFVDPFLEDISFKGKIIFINKLEKPESLGRIMRYLKLYFRNPQSNRFVLDFRGDTKVFPNIFTLLATLVYYYKKIGKKIIVHTHDYSQIERTRFWDPHEATYNNLNSSLPIRDTIWLIKDDFQLNFFCDRVIKLISTDKKFGKNALECLRIAIPEAIENALIHSQVSHAFCMLQTHKTNNWVSLAICDDGVGIYKTLDNAGYNFYSNLDAIVASVKRGVSSRKNDRLRREGNGLFLLTELVRKNVGQFGLFSGSDGIIITNSDIQGRVYDGLAYISDTCPATLVDFQIDVSKEISMGSIYSEVTNNELYKYFGSIPAKTFTSYKIIDSEIGFATRKAADTIVNKLMDVLCDPTFPGFILDFSGIPICTPSFIDELISGLENNLGKSGFLERIRVSNLDDYSKQFIVEITDGAKIFM